MHIEPFALERWQSHHENTVEINLSDSGVEPLTLRDVLDPDECARLLDEPLVYVQTNGTLELRERVAALHSGAVPDGVEITNGGSEANLVALWTLIEPDDDVVLMTPNYGQIAGLARSWGANVREWRLIPDHDGGRWRVDFDQLARLVSRKTRVIAVCHPDNPTGAILGEDDIAAIVAIARGVGAWVLADEIYRGSELDGPEVPTFFGRYERTVVTGGLSKAYGLPGLRIGWALAPPPTIEAFWTHHDYSSIAPGALSDRVARLVLEPARRARILEHTRAHLRRNVALVASWIASRPGDVAWIAPRAGAMAFVRYRKSIASIELVERLRRERSVLLVPGEHFGFESWLRIGFGGRAEELAGGLDRLGSLLD